MSAGEKLLLASSLDYVSQPLLRKLAEQRVANVLCIVSEGGAEATTECNAHGFTCISSNDAALISGVATGFAADVGIFVGEDFPEGVLEKCVATCRRALQVKFNHVNASNAPYPEFEPIFSGQTESTVEIVDIDVNSGRKALLGTAVVPITDLDTAISLRYRYVRALPDLVLNALNTDATQCADYTGNAVYMKTENTWTCFIEPQMDAREADRFIRACTFPPKINAKVRSDMDFKTSMKSIGRDRLIKSIKSITTWLGCFFYIDGLDYYVDSFAQYLDYLVSIGATPDKLPPGHNGSAGSASGLIDTQVANSSSSYAGDTHWYSNVGGTIVKMASESNKMRKVEEKSQRDFIPGQAVSASAKKRLRMNEPLIGLTAQKYISGALTSGWIGVEGPHIKKFESAIARVCNVDAACAVQSGTAALYGAMKALGVSDVSHHVIVPTYTCAACADAIVHAGGVPLAVDCEIQSYGLDFDAVKECLDNDDQVCGIVIAPCYGVPSRDHMKIWNLCKERGIWLCEDNCESYGAVMQIEDDNLEHKLQEATSENAPVANVGSISTMSVVSVRSEKMVGVGEGGAILSKDAALVSKARWWCSRTPVRGCGLWRVYEHENVGQNFRLPELLGAVGLAATENLPVMIGRKREIHAYFKTSEIIYRS